MGDAEQAPWPTSVDEAVDRLLADMQDEDTAALRAMSEDDLIDLHFGLGMYIRNAFGLWQGNKALLASCAEAEGGSGFIDPDDASGVIIEALWRRVRGQ